jgi:hypothetical protein
MSRILKTLSACFVLLLATGSAAAQRQWTVTGREAPMRR